MATVTGPTTSKVGNVVTWANTTGSVVADSGNQMLDWLNVKAFGATGNGTTDDTAAINATITALGTKGGTVYFPSGTYLISSTITIPAAVDISFVGANQGATTLKYSPATGDLLLINNANYFSISSLSIVGNSMATSGALIHLEYTGHFLLSDVFIQNGAIAIQMDGSNTTADTFRYTLRDFMITGTTSTAILIGFAVTTNPPQDVFIGPGLIASCHAGIGINSTGGTYITDVDITKSTIWGVSILPGSGLNVTTVRLHNVLCDTSGTEGFIVGTSGTGTCSDIELVGCWAAVNAMAGIDINGANVNGVVITGGYFSSNGQDGIRLDAGTNIVINGASVFTNNTTNAGYSGITIQAGSGFQITNCVSGLGGFAVTTGNHQAYGIAVNSTSSNNFIITGNRMPGNVTGGLGNFATGANQVVANNLAF